jgi:hypothetical protein
MVRWNVGTEHVKTQRQRLSPAGAQNRDLERVHPRNPFIRQGCCWHWMASTRGLAHPFGGTAPTISIAKSARVYELSSLHLHDRPASRTNAPKPVAGLPIQIGNDKGRYHSLKSTARGRSCGGRLLAFVATLPLAGRGCSKLPPKPTSGESSALAQLAGLRILQRLHTPFRTLELAAIAEWSRSQHALKARLIASALEKP